MHLIGKHPSGQCECGLGEDTGACHLSLPTYNTQREKLQKEMRKCGVDELNLKNWLNIGEGKYKVFLNQFLKETGLMKTI